MISVQWPKYEYSFDSLLLSNQGWRFRREKPVFPGRVGKTWEISVFPGKIRLKWEILGNLVGKSVRFLNFSFVFHVSVSMSCKYDGDH